MNSTSELTEKQFEQYPVWAWTEDEEGYTPVVDAPPLPLDRGPLLVKAKLTPATGPTLDGYVIGLASVYALGIFAGGTDHVFNARLGAEAGELASLFAALGVAPFELFPLRFATGFTFADGTAMEGVFAMNE